MAEKFNPQQHDMELAATYAGFCLAVLMQDSDFRPRLLATMRASLHDSSVTRSLSVRREIERMIKHFEQFDQTH